METVNVELCGVHDKLLDPTSATGGIRVGFGSGPAVGMFDLCFNLSEDVGCCGQEVSISVFKIVL